MTQLDPIACDACLAKMKGGGKSRAGQGLADAIAGPLGIWQALPEMTKLAAVVVALVIGLLIGYVAGKMTAPPSTRSTTGSSRMKETTHSEPTTPTDDSTSEEASEVRPDPLADEVVGYGDLQRIVLEIQTR